MVARVLSLYRNVLYMIIQLISQAVFNVMLAILFRTILLVNLELIQLLFNIVKQLTIILIHANNAK